MTQSIDSVRASVEGHAFHHAWAARSALELLRPQGDLKRIAIEGFDLIDEASGLSPGVVEIADLTRYYGGERAEAMSRIEIVQFKYSHANAGTPVRAHELSKTIAKFAAGLTEFEAKLGEARARDKVRFALETNRPFGEDLIAACVRLRDGETLAGDAVDRQAHTLKAATGLEDPDAIRAFFARLSLVGRLGSALVARGEVARLIVSWSPSADAQARFRQRNLLTLIVEKAGLAGAGNKTITQTDVLGAFELGQPSDLIPAPSTFPEVAGRIERQAVGQLVERLERARLPLIVEATGGMGKTVLMQTTAARLKGPAYCLLFDGYASGQWRNAADSRHQLDRGLPQLANQMALDGLCDPLLPGPASLADWMRSFRRRLEQAVETLSRQGISGGLILFLDAIDHAAERARETGDPSFAAELMQHLSLDPLAGVRLVASCRSERLELTRGDIECETFSVPKFTEVETRAVIAARRPQATRMEIAVLVSRSGGNPRVLNTLLQQGPPFDTDAGDLGVVPLETLLAKQFEQARREALGRGADREQIAMVLAALALLPPPVPVEELAAAQGLSPEAIRSFAADLFPLIELTSHGLIFRDEPTEDFVRGQAKLDSAARERVLQRLDQRQEISVYAARALPLVLRDQGRADLLQALAFDKRLPRVATSGVAQRAIRLARLDAALKEAARQQNLDQLLAISVELAHLTAGHGRSDGYLRSHPDLVALSGDAEALRRLVEDRSIWEGAHHANRALAQGVLEENADALRHARLAIGWHNSRVEAEQQGRSWPASAGPWDQLGPAWVLLNHRNLGSLGRWLFKGQADAAFAKVIRVLQLIDRQAGLTTAGARRRGRLHRAVGRLRQPPTIVLAALLAKGQGLDPQLRDRLLGKLAAARDELTWTPDRFDHRKPANLSRALVDIALSCAVNGEHDRARAILERANLERVRAHEFDGPVLAPEPLGGLVMSALIRALIEGRAVEMRDLAPSEADGLVRGRARRSPGAYVEAMAAALAKSPSPRAKTETESRQRLARTLKHRVGPLVSLLEAVRADIAAYGAAGACKALLDRFLVTVDKTEDYPFREQRRFISGMLSEVAFRLLAALPSPDTALGNQTVSVLKGSHYHYLPHQIELVDVLARQNETTASARCLARAIAVELKRETSSTTRIQGLAALARAVWPASAAEGRDYFNTGLQQADGASADDVEETMGLMGLAERYRGVPLAPTVVHGFSRLCELHMVDEPGRFDWRTYAFATAQLGGLNALATSTRLASRDLEGLHSTLPMLLTALVDAKALPASLASGLIGLEEYFDTWNFQLPEVLKALLPDLTPVERERLLADAAVELDRRYGASVSVGLLAEAIAASSPYVSQSDPTLARWKRLAGAAEPRAGKERYATGFADRLAQDGAEAAMARVVGATDWRVKAALDDNLNRLSESLERHTGRLPAQFIARLARDVDGPDAQLLFLDAVAQMERATLPDKLLGLGSVLEDWLAASSAVAAALTPWLEGLLDRHRPQLALAGWDADFVLRRVPELAPQAMPAPIVAARILGMTSGQVEGIGAKGWFLFANALAPAASSAALGTAITRYVDQHQAGLPADEAGGAWAPELTAPDTAVEAIAGTLWFCLGAGDARRRWRAAHAVRRLHKQGRGDILQALAERLHTETAGPFQDQKRPFSFLNAKLWLCLAFARIAVDDPGAVAPFRQALEAAAFDEYLPHVLIRAFAGRALAALAKVLPAGEAESLSARLQGMNASSFPIPKSVSKGSRADFYKGREPEDRRDPPFYFDYDFDKYRVTALANLFGVSRGVAANAIIDWVRTWAPDARHMSENEKQSWSGGRKPIEDSWPGHLAWHGQFLAAGQFLKTHALTRRYAEIDPWTDWFRQFDLAREDGRWLADETDLCPEALFQVLVDDGELVPKRAAKLTALIGLDQPAPTRLVIDGAWRSREGLDVWVRSAFVPTNAATAAALTLALSSEWDVWLPRADDSRDHTVFLPWLKDVENWGRGELDKIDPYASLQSIDRVELTAETCTHLGLSPEGPLGRVWGHGEGGKVELEVWGGERHAGREPLDTSGRRMWIDLALARKEARRRNASLVVLAFVSRYGEGRHSERAYHAQWVTTLYDGNGKITMPKPVPRTVAQAARGLGAEGRRDFDRLFATVQNALRADG